MVACMVEAEGGQVAGAGENGAPYYLAAPASSAGVERVFSAAGKMHNDLRKSMKDQSLKHSLFASFNTK